MQLKVIKADGSTEEYLHTKVLGTISNALGAVDEGDVFVAEEFSEVVTYYLYHKQEKQKVSSGEIFAMVKAVLTGTGHEAAALALSEHHCLRRLGRARTEVVSLDIEELSDAERLWGDDAEDSRSRWDKSRIAVDLIAKHGLARQAARTIAGLVEEKVLAMGLTQIPASLIRQIVLGDTAAVVRAHQQLLTA
jgi:transcriptional regulator NrdR family protein